MMARLDGPDVVDARRLQPRLVHLRYLQPLHAALRTSDNSAKSGSIQPIDPFPFIAP